MNCSNQADTGKEAGRQDSTRPVVFSVMKMAAPRQGHGQRSGRNEGNAIIGNIETQA